MDFLNEYRKKSITAEEAAKIVKSGDWIDYSQCCSFPTDLDKALAARKDELTDVKVRNAISALPIAVVEEDPDQTAFTYNLWHCSRSEERRVGKECSEPCRSRWSPYH